MGVRTDTVNLNVNVNSNVAANQLNELRNKASQLNVEMKGLRKSTQEYKDKAAELKQVNADMDTLKKTIGLAALSQKELISEINKLKALKGSVIPFSDEYKQLDKSIAQVEKRLYDVKNGTTGFASFLGKLSEEIKAFGIVTLSYFGFQFLSAAFSGIVKGAAKITDQLADLRRVAGLTAEAAKHLNSQLTNLDTRTTTGSLREIAIVAGKLGVAKEDIFGFTAAVDKMVVALGDELGNADEITTKLGKILNVFDGKVTGEGITKLGNAFVELANTGVATGGFIAEFDQRLSGIAQSSGISLGALSGLGAGLEEMGSKVESSSTAVQKLIIGIAEDIPAAAKIAGLSTKEFNKLFATDGTEALLKYTEGLVKNKASFSEITKSLKDAGEEGARTIATITKLGEGADLLRSRIDLGKKSIEESASITEAFRLKNETFGATLDKLGKEFSKLSNSSILKDFLVGAVEKTLSFIKALRALPQYISDNSTALKLLVAGIVLLNFSYVKSAATIAVDTAVKIRNAIATQALAIAQRATAIATAIAETAQASYIVVSNLLTGSITLQIAAIRLWNIALSIGAGPLGIIVTLVGAVVYAMTQLTGASTAVTAAQAIQNETIREANKETNKQKAEIEGLVAVIDAKNVSDNTKEATLKRLIALSPEYLNRLTLENIATKEGKRILDEYNIALQANANIKAASTIQERENQKDVSLRTLKQELEIARTRGADRFKNLSPEAKDAISEAAGTDPFETALKTLQTRIDAQSENVKAATANFVNQTQTQETARKNFLIHNITIARQEQNGAIKDSEEYKKATIKLIDARRKFEEEFGNKKTKDITLTDPSQTAAEAKAEAKALRDQENKYKKLKADAEKFEEELRKIKDKAVFKSEDPEQGEIDAVKAKYADLVKRAKEFYIESAIDTKQFNADEKLIAEAQAAELETIFEKFLKKRLAEQAKSEYQDSIIRRQEFSGKQKDTAAQQFAEGVINKNQYERQLTEIETNEVADRILIAQDYSATVKDAEKDLFKFRKEQAKLTTENVLHETQQQADYQRRNAIAIAQRAVLVARPDSPQQFEARKNLLKIQMEQELKTVDLTDEEILTKKAQLNKDLEDLDRQSNIAKIDNVLQYVDQFTNALNSINKILQAKDTAAFNKEKALSDKRKKLLKDQLNHRLISQSQYDIKVNALQEEQDKKQLELKRKQAKREKALNLFSAVINGIAAVVKTMASMPYPLNIALAIAQGIASGLQIAAIANEPLPTFGLGDWVRKGDKHRDPSGGINAKIERDEAVITAKAMTSNKVYTVTGTTAQITSALNSTAGGASWAGGATIKTQNVPNLRVASINPNLPRIMEQGGIIRPLSIKGNAPTDDDRIVEYLKKIISNQEENIEATKNKNEKIRGVFSIKEFDKTKELYEQAKKVSGLG